MMNSSIPGFPLDGYSKKAHTHGENPATLSPLLTGLFPAGVVGAELQIPSNPSLLYPEEVLALGRAHPKRVQEFTAGRLCARRALSEFGFTTYPLLISTDGQPHWPDTLCGSISHTAGMCGAVVGEKNKVRGIGLDIEIVAQVTAELWPTICTPREIAWLSKLPHPQQTRCAALIFCAKESFYKCQYSVTHQWLEFDAVELDVSTPLSETGWFVLIPQKKIILLDQAETPLRGRYVFYKDLIITGIHFETALN